MGRSGDGEGEPSCIVKLVATWSDKANEESGSDNKGRRRAPAGVVDVFPIPHRNLIGFTAINLRTLYGTAATTNSNNGRGRCHRSRHFTWCVNTTTGQVALPHAAQHRFPIYECVRE